MSKRSISAYANSLPGAITNCIRSMRTSSRRRGVGPGIDRKHIWELWEEQNGLCALSGLPMDVKVGSIRRVSLDRIDSSRWYLIGNVQLVCKWANFGKGNMTNDEFKEILQEVRERHRARAAGKVL